MLVIDTYCCMTMLAIFMSLIIGFPLFFGFLGTYNELQHFKSDYIPAVCKSGPHFSYSLYDSFTRYMIYGVIYNDINVYIPDTNGTLEYKFNTYIRKPSTSYQIVYKSLMNGLKINSHRVVTNDLTKPEGIKCMVSKSLTGVGIIEIDYEQMIESCFFTGIVFSGFSFILVACLVIHGILYPIIKYYAISLANCCIYYPIEVCKDKQYARYCIKAAEYNTGNKIIVNIPDAVSSHVNIPSEFTMYDARINIESINLSPLHITIDNRESNL